MSDMAVPPDVAITGQNEPREGAAMPHFDDDSTGMRRKGCGHRKPARRKVAVQKDAHDAKAARPRPTFDMSASRKREQPSLEMIPEKGLHQWLTKRCEHGPGKPVIAQSIWQTNSA
jgi:hypothetical protein